MFEFIQNHAMIGSILLLLTFLVETDLEDEAFLGKFALLSIQDNNLHRA